MVFAQMRPGLKLIEAGSTLRMVHELGGRLTVGSPTTPAGLKRALDEKRQQKNLGGIRQAQGQVSADQDADAV